MKNLFYCLTLLFLFFSCDKDDCYQDIHKEDLYGEWLIDSLEPVYIDAEPSYIDDITKFILQYDCDNDRYRFSPSYIDRKSCMIGGFACQFYEIRNGQIIITIRDEYTEASDLLLIADTLYLNHDVTWAIKRFFKKEAQINTVIVRKKYTRQY